MSLSTPPNFEIGPGLLIEGLLYLLQNELANYITQANSMARMTRYQLEVETPQAEEIQAHDIPALPIEHYPAIRLVLTDTDTERTGTQGTAESATRLVVRVYTANYQGMPGPGVGSGGVALANVDAPTALLFKQEALTWAVVQAIIEKLPGLELGGLSVGAWSVGPPRIQWRGAGQIPRLDGVVGQTDITWVLNQDTRHMYGG